MVRASDVPSPRPPPGCEKGAFDGMVFSSIIFLFAFLPVVLIVYHLLFLPVWWGTTAKVWRHRANLFLLLVRLLFYFWGEKVLIWVFLATVFIDYFCALLISG